MPYLPSHFLACISKFLARRTWLSLTLTNDARGDESSITTNHGGSRLDWPMTIEVMDLGEDDTTVVRGSFRINMRMEPTFHADATTADESSDAGIIAVPVDPK